MRKVTGFGSDGAAVMTGMNKGVQGRLKAQHPHIVQVHCMAHILALCTLQAARDIAALKKYQEWLTTLFYYLKASASREQELHKIQEIMEHPMLKYKEVHAVRWLSFYEALEAVFRTIDPLITYLHNRKAANDSKAKGILKQMATTEFIYITYVLMDVIPIVMRLCLVFQKKDLDVAQAKIARDLCLAELEAYKTDTQLHETYLQQYGTDVKEVDSQFEYKGQHFLKSTNLNCAGVKAQFLSKLIFNINERFPQKTLLDAFYVLSMRTINFDQQPENYGNKELDRLLQFYGEEQVHSHKVSPPLVSKELVKQQWQMAKIIVHSANYAVDDMQGLWTTVTKYHREDLGELLKLVQLALTLPLHTADCERVFSQQNIILTKQRNRLTPVISDRLLRIRLHGQTLSGWEFQKTLAKWHKKKRVIKTGLRYD